MVVSLSRNIIPYALTLQGVPSLAKAQHLSPNVARRAHVLVQPLNIKRQQWYQFYLVVSCFVVFCSPNMYYFPNREPVSVARVLEWQRNRLAQLSA